MSHEEQFTRRCLSGHLHIISETNTQICCDRFGEEALEDLCTCVNGMASDASENPRSGLLLLDS